MAKKPAGRVPTSTYRLQFRGGLRLSDARRLVPYLHDLGAGDLYASPLFAAGPGSTHGYDVTDPTRLDPSLGTNREFEALSEALHRKGMGLLLGIVPNHMSTSAANPWWTDVLENGPASTYARHFDIDWHRPGPLRGRVVLPILGDELESCLQKGDLYLDLDNRGIAARYFNERLPLDPGTWGPILARAAEHLARGGGGERELAALAVLAAEASRVPGRSARAPARREKRAAAVRRVKKRLQNLAASSGATLSALQKALSDFNSGHEAGRARLRQMLDGQAYSLEFWKTGAANLNYRRFFDITGLAGVRVEDPPVFAATHGLALRLLREGKVTGLRIDHVDGLRDPAGYLRRLQAAIAAGMKPARDRGFVVVEKVLVGEEVLPGDWPVAGTTGYDYLRIVDSLFVEPAGLEALKRRYARLTGQTLDFEELVYEKKKKVADALFRGELERLTEAVAALADDDERARDLTRAQWRTALVEMAARLPVYRTYIRSRRISGRDRNVIRTGAEAVRQKGSPAVAAAIDFLQRVLTMELPPAARKGAASRWLDFAMRFQQFTGPVMAKGQEDTAFYAYTPLVSLNEVGGEPSVPADAVAAFHSHSRRIIRDWPDTMNATATHDTKRGEDVRARINVLSEIAPEWHERLDTWRALNRDKRRAAPAKTAPDPNEEALIYQTVLGAYPLDRSERPDFPARMREYVVKAAREAKVNTSWRAPDHGYERALAGFVDQILSPAPGNPFLESVLEFLPRVAYWGAINSLARTLLQITSPGLPDVYQGTELWDLNLVDPDNRRPVDFSLRQRVLRGIIRRAASDRGRLVRDVLSRWQDGRVKMYLTWMALTHRRGHPDLFRQGRYLPLRAAGERSRNVVSFARSLDGAWALIAAPRLFAGLLPAGTPPTSERAWGDTTLTLPHRAPAKWTNILTGESVSSPARGRTRVLYLRDVMAQFPVALLTPG